MEAEATTETTMAHTKKKSQKQNKTKKLKNTKNQKKKKNLNPYVLLSTANGHSQLRIGTGLDMCLMPNR